MFERDEAGARDAMCSMIRLRKLRRAAVFPRDCEARVMSSGGGLAGSWARIFGGSGPKKVVEAKSSVMERCSGSEVAVGIGAAV